MLEGMLIVLKDCYEFLLIFDKKNELKKMIFITYTWIF